MLKRLLIPGLAIGALSFSVNPAKAGTFTLDNYDNTINGNLQRVAVGTLSPAPRFNTQGTQTNPLSGVFGGSRTLRINELTNPQQLVNAAVISSNPTLDRLGIINNSGVISRALVRYDGNGTGLHNLKNAQGYSLGDWSAGSFYDFDFFAVKLLDLDTTMNMTFKIEDSSGQVAQLTRVIQKINDQIVIDNPTNSKLSSAPTNTAIFSFSEFVANNNINFKSIRAAQIEFTGDVGLDAQIDFVQGVEVPEPSLGVGTIIILGLGIASVKRNKNNSEEEII